MKLALAPMQDVTDLAFMRTLHRMTSRVTCEMSLVSCLCVRVTAAAAALAVPVKARTVFRLSAAPWFTQNGGLL